MRPGKATDPHQPASKITCGPLISVFVVCSLWLKCEKWRVLPPEVLSNELPDEVSERLIPKHASRRRDLVPEGIV